jgi:hypothetical protein
MLAPIGWCNPSSMHAFILTIVAAAAASKARLKAQCGGAMLTCVTAGFGGPSVAHTIKPSRTDTAANRRENPLTP